MVDRVSLIWRTVIFDVSLFMAWLKSMLHNDKCIADGSYCHVIGVSLSKPHSNIQNGMSSMRENHGENQHTSTVWYGGSCTNKHDKVTRYFQKHLASFSDVPC